MDFKKYYYLEQYLFNEVGPAFRKTGQLTDKDFLCILIWKSNRSKTKNFKKLMKTTDSKIRGRASQLAKDIHNQPTSREKLYVLIKDWKFRLPTASAILTVLYPDDFTIYDARVCSVINRFYGLADKSFDCLWAEYEKFIKCVNKASQEKSLRDKDRYLWGKSFYKDLERTLARFRGRTKRLDEKVWIS